MFLLGACETCLPNDAPGSNGIGGVIVWNASFASSWRLFVACAFVGHGRKVRSAKVRRRRARPDPAFEVVKTQSLAVLFKLLRMAIIYQMIYQSSNDRASLESKTYTRQFSPIPNGCNSSRIAKFKIEPGSFHRTKKREKLQARSLFLQKCINC